MNTFKKIYRFIDKKRKDIRAYLSHHPIFYAFIGGTGVVIFWRGIWHTVDFFMEYFININKISSTSLSSMPWWDGPLSIIIGFFILSITGLFVANLIGAETILSGLRGEKQLTEKTEREVKKEMEESIRMKEEIHEMDTRIKHVEKILSTKK